MNTLLNTLYTPLDCPPLPNVDIEELKNWITEYNIKLKEIRTFMNQGSKLGEAVATNYPWAPVNPFNRMFEGWQGKFDEKFPELSNYFASAFGLTHDDINNLLVLPVKDQYVGRFWHQDPDEYGLRLYLEYEDTPNPLLLKKTKEAYTEQAAISPRYFSPGSVVPDINQFLQDEIYTCKHTPTGCFYINNVRAAHTIDVIEPGKKRIAVIIYHNKSQPVLDKINALVERSLEKYSEYAITY